MKTFFISIFSTILLLCNFPGAFAIPCHSENDPCRDYWEPSVLRFFPLFSLSYSLNFNSPVSLSEEFSFHKGGTPMASVDISGNNHWKINIGQQSKNQEYQYSSHRNMIFTENTRGKLVGKITRGTSMLPVNGFLLDPLTGETGIADTRFSDIREVIQVKTDQVLDTSGNNWKKNDPTSDVMGESNHLAPEPSTFLHLGIGLLILVFFQKKRKKI